MIVRNPAAEAAVAQRRREWAARERRRRHAEQVTLMPVAVWVALGVLVLAALATLNLAALPGLGLVGCGVWVYAQRRRRRVAENLARDGRF